MRPTCKRGQFGEFVGDHNGGFIVALERQQGKPPKLTLLDDVRLAELAAERKELGARMAALKEKVEKVRK